MPTGYTLKLMEEGQTFQEFAMLCARAFGACITMRDDPMDAPIPEEFKPSDYHSKALINAKNQLRRLKRMSGSERSEFGEKEKRNNVKAWKDSIAAKKVENARLEAMRQQVEAWQPPTNDHSEFKAFMLQQIEVSIGDSSYAISALRDAESMTATGYWKSALDEAQRDIEYHTKEAKAEVKRCETRTKWVRDLRESLLGPRQKAA